MISIATELDKCPDCGKDNPFSGVKAGCKTCKQTIENTAKEAEADGSREQIASIVILKKAE